MMPLETSHLQVWCKFSSCNPDESKTTKQLKNVTRFGVLKQPFASEIKLMADATLYITTHQASKTSYNQSYISKLEVGFIFNLVPRQ
jgi:hypothetical protein